VAAPRDNAGTPLLAGRVGVGGTGNVGGSGSLLRAWRLTVRLLV